ncbi:DUF3192 domain-containing protein [Corallincola spongiicola]|uniref:DUF3192 domain-containing protein n=1 Tax=Corallincola spongiicola TaxID=2520508 RepID=A0ABY1WS01_9GAMM|nr:DUF3192 domain-containing protein [Corallincola spongiicola]TAA47527.1 DUF3192 domain-containing protein [Corallincola spongiicola]
MNKDNRILGKIVIAGLLVYGLGVYSWDKVMGSYPENMDWEDRQVYNRNYINSLSLDTPILQATIIEELGAPDIAEAITFEDYTYQVVFYRTQHVSSDAKTTKDECTPLLFKNGELVAFGEGTYKRYIDAL